MMADDRDIYWMKQALEQAELAKACGEVPVGAVLVKDDQLIAAAHNAPITLHDPSAHAEINVLRKAGQALDNYRLVDTTLYVTLEPCLMCFGALMHARVARVVFGAKDQRVGAVHSLLESADGQAAFNHHIAWSAGVLAEPCANVLTDFFANRRSH